MLNDFDGDVHFARDRARAARLLSSSNFDSVRVSIQFERSSGSRFSPVSVTGTDKICGSLFVSLQVCCWHGSGITHRKTHTNFLVW